MRKLSSRPAADERPMLTVRQAAEAARLLRAAGPALHCRRRACRPPVRPLDPDLPGRSGRVHRPAPLRHGLAAAVSSPVIISHCLS